MANGTVPYLCGGTFFYQILRAKKPSATATEHTKGKKDSLSEPETLRRLISIYQLVDFLDCSSLGPNTSSFKSCKDSLTSFAQFTDSDRQRKFDSAVKKKNSVALRMMWDFVNEFIDVEDKGEQLVRCLLGMIMDDGGILPDDIFLLNGKPVTKQELIGMRRFEIEPFLLGVWHYIIMRRADKNKDGAATYQSWYAGRNDYRGHVGNDISDGIIVKSISSEPPVAEAETATDEQPESSSAETQNAQHIEYATVVNQYGENCLHIDHVDVLNL